MKRFHVHLHVADLERSVRFYSTLFGAEPTTRRHDYAKWLLDDPALNFALSARAGNEGEVAISHLGLQFDTACELGAFAKRSAATGAAARAERDANCCYARSDKEWVADPSGVLWEAFRTKGGIDEYGADAGEVALAPTAVAVPRGVEGPAAEAAARCCA